MSTDNWGVCPKCAKIAKDKHEEEKNALKEKYGKVSQSEYMKLIKESKKNDFIHRFASRKPLLS